MIITIKDVLFHSEKVNLITVYNQRITLFGIEMIVYGVKTSDKGMYTEIELELIPADTATAKAQLIAAIKGEP